MICCVDFDSSWISLELEQKYVDNFVLAVQCCLPTGDSAIVTSISVTVRTFTILNSCKA